MAHVFWDLEPGDLLVPGRRVVRALGGGGAHEVLLVWDEARHTRMVAKTVRPDRVEDARAIRALRREGNALAALGHPAIVRGYEIDPNPPRPHLLIEHVEGPSLRDLLRRHGPLPLERLLALAVRIAGALHFIASAGYVHLDVKPANIVMGAPPRLIDFSLARSRARAKRLHRPVGTAGYMAPEHGAPGRVGPAADVWGLGATLHHALSGRRPSREPGPLPSWLPDELASLITEMLDPEPEQRPQASEVVARLQPTGQSWTGSLECIRSR